MLTTVTHTIKASGGDYTSLASWEAAQQRNLVSLDEITVAECYGFVDTTVTTVSGWTTGINNYIEIRAHPSAKATIPMTTDGSRYLLRVPAAGSTTALNIQQQYTRVYDIQVENLGLNTNNYGFVPTTNNTFRNCVARLSFADAGTPWFFQGVSNVRLQNCVGIVDLTGGNGRCFRHDNASVQYDNCTAVSGGTAANFVVNGVTANGIILRNCLSINFRGTGLCYSIAGTGLAVPLAVDLIKSTNNVSNDGSAFGTNPLLNQRPIFVNSSIGDFHLDWMDAVAQGNGANLSASDTGSFSDDFDGNTRTSPWSIGALNVSNSPNAIRLGNTGNSNIQLSSTGTSPITIR
jgi:hypothetical protein